MLKKNCQLRSRIAQRLNVRKRTPRLFARCSLAGRPFLRILRRLRLPFHTEDVTRVIRRHRVFQQPAGVCADIYQAVLYNR
jgi:hypothetical protein